MLQPRPTIGGTVQSIRFQPACPIPTWCPRRSDYLGQIAHANFITTTLAPMGEPAVEKSENDAARVAARNRNKKWRGKKGKERKGKERKEISKRPRAESWSIQHAVKRQRKPPISFGNRASARPTWPYVVKWRAHLRGWGRFWRGEGGEGKWRWRRTIGRERLAHHRVVIAVGNRDRLKLTRAPRIYRGVHAAHRHARLCHPETLLTWSDVHGWHPLFLVNRPSTIESTYEISTPSIAMRILLINR